MVLERMADILVLVLRRNLLTNCRHHNTLCCRGDSSCRHHVAVSFDCLPGADDPIPCAWCTQLCVECCSHYGIRSISLYHSETPKRILFLLLSNELQHQLLSVCCLRQEIQERPAWNFLLHLWHKEGRQET